MLRTLLYLFAHITRLMRRLILILTLLITHTLSAQVYVGGFLGAMGYDGDLNAKPLKRIKPSVGASFSYAFTNRLNLRLGVLLGSLEGGDQWSGDEYLKQNRNLSFRTDITEGSLVGEFTAFNLNKINWTPYIFGGVALFHFNPYIRDSGEKLFLKPLSTEGQGLAEYPDRQPYSLLQLSFPFGGGIRFVAKENLILSFELGIRKTNTDYLDDISKSYVDGNILLQRKGPKAAEFFYRADEVPGGISSYPDNGFPLKNVERGGPKYKDWYYIAGVHAVFRLDVGKKIQKDKKSYGCAISTPSM